MAQQWTYVVNPFAPLPGASEAKAASGGSSIALVITGVMSAVGVVLMSQNLDDMRMAVSEEARALADQSPQTAALLQGMVENGMIEISVAVVAAWALIQFLLAAMHWRRPSAVVPVIFLALLIYRLGDRLLNVVTGSEQAPIWTLVGVPLLILCILLHATTLRAVSRLGELRRAA